MILKPNLSWEQNQGKELPTVLADISLNDDYLSVAFSVEEPIDCFRAEVQKDNDRSWEDSCVEIFLRNPANPNEYFNFETTSRGFVLAAHGENRDNREMLPQETIDKIRRTKQLASVIGNLVCWGMTIDIPAEIFELQSFKGVQLYGNLYKCADKSKSPHYLSAFPVNTEKPDFHRPEFFEKINP